MVEYTCRCGLKVVRYGVNEAPEGGLCAECGYVESLPTEEERQKVRRLLSLIDGGAAVRPGIEGGHTS